MKKNTESLSDIRVEISRQIGSDVLGSLKKSNKEEEIIKDKEELTLFVSFDLVNSTAYKTQNYTTWFSVLITINERIQEYMSSKINKCQLWRSIGDEIIFIVTIQAIEELEQYIQIVFKILNDIIKEIKNGEILKDNFDKDEKKIFIARNMLSLKAAAWIALVNQTAKLSEKPNNIHNLVYIYNNDRYSEGFPMYEFQGNDIDAGFRVKKYTTDRRLVLSLELAYLLSKNQYIDPKISIITYRKLKGIWNNQLYPIIWYHDSKITNQKLEDSFFYDEYYKDELTKEYLDNEYKFIKFDEKSTTFQKLDKIIKDKNITTKISNIESSLKANNEHTKLIEANKMIELHAVAICIKKSTNEVLMFKRKSDARLYKNLWDFGCSEVQNGQTFKENLEKQYKVEFNIEIRVLDPIKEYSFENPDKKLIPGIRFMAIIKDDSKLRIKSNEYCDQKYISIDEFINLEGSQKNEYLEYEQFKQALISVKNILGMEK